jgi:NAD kinase
VIDKVVLVTQKTRLEELQERFNTREQAKFWIEHMGLDFADYDREHATYHRAVVAVQRSLEPLVPKLQTVERTLLPTLLFTSQDAVVTVGRDGLVANTAKYADSRPILAVNTDPARWDGLLLPFSPLTIARGMLSVLESRANVRRVTMAEARLNDGQRLLAFNDFLIGRRDHLSARYVVALNGRQERQSSSGILVSTGAGSTGWLASTQNMAESVMGLLRPGGPVDLPRLRLAWEDPRLVFVVREPFRSRSTGVSLAAGLIEPTCPLEVESLMPEGGAIFSDGVPEDALAFDSGCVATVGPSDRTAVLVADAGRDGRLGHRVESQSFARR